MRVAIPELHPDASAVSAFRILPSGEGRAYTVSDPSGGRDAIARALFRAQRLGYVTPPGDDDYAVLDIVGGNDDVIQDYGIPHAKACGWWGRTVRWRVAPEED